MAIGADSNISLWRRRTGDPSMTAGAFKLGFRVIDWVNILFHNLYEYFSIKEAESKGGGSPSKRPQGLLDFKIQICYHFFLICRKHQYN